MKLLTKKPECYNWIIENFPKNYTSKIYLEPYCSSLNIYLNKESSIEEYINDIDCSYICLYRTIRDNLSNLLLNIKNIKNDLNTFLNARKTNNFSNNLDKAINELILIVMSEEEKKENYNKDNKWDLLKDLLVEISNKISNLYIFNSSAVEVIEIFDSKNTFVYCCPPAIQDTLNNNIDIHIEICNKLNKFTGNVLLHTNSSSYLYFRMLKNWNLKEKDKNIILTNYKTN